MLSNKLFYIPALIVFLVIAIWFLTPPTSSFDYSNKIYSPNKDYSVVPVESNGGATTAYITDIVVIHENELPNGWNIFNRGNKAKTSVFAFEGAKSSVEVSWLENRTLKIIYTNCNQIYGQDNSWKDIKIVYEEKCSGNN